MKKTLFLVMFFVPFCVLAVSPQFWEENTQQQFAAGDPQMVSITSDGELMLAPQLKKVYQGTDSIIWKILTDGQNIYAATGNEGKILKIDSAGKATPLLDTNELEVQNMLLDPDGNLYAATSPDGKIYKIKKDGTSQIFFDPSDKYIWSMAFDDASNLYVATGDDGKIYRVDKNGKGEVFADTTEANITALLWDKEKGLLAGSDRNGLLYAIASSGKTSVLFDSDQQQITSIYRNASGEIYVAAITGVGPVAPDSRMMPPQPSSQPVTPPQPQDDDNDQGGEATVVTTVEVMPITPQATMTPTRPTASELYRINSDGTSELIYSSDDHILDIQTGNGEDSLILSTGKEAKLIKVTKNKKSTILLKTSEDQITSVISGKRTLFSTANPGHIYELVQNHSATGTYFSDIKDTGTPSSWGRLTWKSETPAGTSVTLSTRSGNTKSPDETWSAWSNAGNNPTGQQMSSAKGRFAQWKADFTSSNPEVTPILRGVKLAYLQQNLRPSMDAVVVMPPGAVYKKTSFAADSVAGAVDSEIESGQQQTEAQQTIQGSLAGKADYRKGYQTITWNASDSNQDTLLYEVYYHEVNEKNWKLLAKDLKENVFAWDTQTIPDGTYVLQVKVSDRLSNPGTMALTNSKDSAPFDVDNSSPRLEVTQVSRNGNTAVVQVKAEDQFSAIKQLQYSVAPGKWVQVFPVDSIDDSPLETYKIEVADTSSDTIVLKCSDQFQNVSTIRHSLAATK